MLSEKMASRIVEKAIKRLNREKNFCRFALATYAENMAIRISPEPTRSFLVEQAKSLAEYPLEAIPLIDIRQDLFRAAKKFDLSAFD